MAADPTPDVNTASDSPSSADLPGDEAAAGAFVPPRAFTRAEHRRLAQIHVEIAWLRLEQARLARLGRAVLLLLFIASAAFSEGATVRTAAENAGGQGRRPCGAFSTPLLADSLTGDQSAWLVNGLAVVGLLIGIAVGVRALVEKRSNSRVIEGQPIDVAAAHPPVKLPEFLKHRDEIWEVVKGLRGAINGIKESIASIDSLRKANGDRLGEVAADVKKLSDDHHEVKGIVRGLRDRLEDVLERLGCTPRK